jgi:hypothetical protein
MYLNIHIILKLENKHRKKRYFVYNVEWLEISLEHDFIAIRLDIHKL